METNEAELLGMDDPRVMASMQARIDGRLLALHGVALNSALMQAKTRTQALFNGALPAHVIAGYVADAYAAAGVQS